MIIKNKVLEYNNMKMEINMRGSGIRINVMVKVHIGLWARIKNRSDIILASIIMIRDRERVLCFLITVIDMMDIGYRIT